MFSLIHLSASFVVELLLDMFVVGSGCEVVFIMNSNRLFICLLAIIMSMSTVSEVMLTQFVVILLSSIRILFIAHAG
ncbi:hypothetical protein Hanom_Chr00s004702g01724451 [Helianthus anomalus]